MNAHPNTPKPRNPEWTGLSVGLVLVALGMLMILLPPILQMDMMRSGYGIACLGSFVLLCGAITCIFYVKRVRTLDRILAGQGLLTHWKYDTRRFEQHAHRTLVARKATNRIYFLTMAFFFVLCTALFSIAGWLNGNEDEMPLFIAIMAAILGILALFAFGMPYVEFRATHRSAPDAWIATDGIYINGGLHTWRGPMEKLDSVELIAKSDEPRLVFNLRYLSRMGWIDYPVEVPVPPGQEEAAQRVIAQLQG